MTEETEQQAGQDEPAVELIDVRKHFGSVAAVDGVSLRVAQGEFLTLLGPSGGGKTTTLRLIGGFETPSSGGVRIGGDDVASLPPHRRPVNTVFQNYALFPHLTVGQNIAYGLQMSGAPRAERDRRAGEALEMVRLPGVEKRKPSELSGGQQQRVALARALVNNPKVLLLDEPLGALDLKLRKAMQLELKALNRETGATFIYVTHDQEEALTMSDRIAVMSEGRILQVDSPSRLYERPRTRFVADFVGQTNFIEGTSRGTDGSLGEVDVPGASGIRARLPEGAAPAGTVAVAVRPEKVVFVQDLPGAVVPPLWNRLSGTVVEAIYLGTHTQFVVNVGNGAKIVVHRQNTSMGGYGLPPGATVEIAFDPASASILAE